MEGAPTSLGVPAAPPGSGSLSLTTRRRPAPSWNIYRHPGGPGRRGGPRAAAERSVGPGHPAPLAVVSGCGRGAERKAAGPTRQPPGAAKGAGTCEGKARFASLRFLSNEMARGPVSLRHRPLTHCRGRGPLRARPAGEAKTRRRRHLEDKLLSGASGSSGGGSPRPVLDRSAGCDSRRRISEHPRVWLGKTRRFLGRDPSGAGL